MVPSLVTIKVRKRPLKTKDPKHWEAGLLLFSCQVMSDSLRPHGLQYTRLPCSSPSPRVCPSSCPLHEWCHPAISSSDTLFFCPQPFPASEIPTEKKHCRPVILFVCDPSNTMAGVRSMSSLFVVQSLSHVPLSVTPWIAACWASLSLTISQNLLKIMPIESVMPSNHLICSYLLLLLTSTFPSTWVFSNESVLCIRWPNYWSFSFSTSPSN